MLKNRISNLIFKVYDHSPAKGQLISKGLFDVIVWIIKTANFFKDFCSSLILQARAEILKKSFVVFLAQTIILSGKT